MAEISWGVTRRERDSFRINNRGGTTEVSKDVKIPPVEDLEYAKP